VTIYLGRAAHSKPEFRSDIRKYRIINSEQLC